MELCLHAYFWRDVKLCTGAGLGFCINFFCIKSVQFDTLFVLNIDFVILILI